MNRLKVSTVRHVNKDCPKQCQPMVRKCFACVTFGHTAKDCCQNCKRFTCTRSARASGASVISEPYDVTVINTVQNMLVAKLDSFCGIPMQMMSVSVSLSLESWVGAFHTW